MIYIFFKDCLYHMFSVNKTCTEKSQDIKSIFGAIVYHIPEMCLLGICGAPPAFVNYSFTPYLHIFDFF